MTLRLEPYRDEHTEEVLAVINAAFGFERSLDWFQWKHREGPWGPSSGMVAIDEHGIAGVRLLLPWRFKGSAGRVLAHRAVEAATAPRAKGQGVFSRLNRELMREATDRGEPTFLFSTPNEQSRSGYQKLGWSWLEPVTHIWRPALPRPGGSSLLSGDAALETFSAGPADASSIGTAWSRESLRWRLDPRAGHEYSVIADSTKSHPSGLAYRVASGSKLRSILPLIAWGPAEQQKRLLGVVARRERAGLLLDTGAVGGKPVGTGPGSKRGNSLLAVWPTPQLSTHNWPVDRIGDWKVGFADLESVL